MHVSHSKDRSLVLVCKSRWHVAILIKSVKPHQNGVVRLQRPRRLGLWLAVLSCRVCRSAVGIIEHYLLKLLSLTFFVIFAIFFIKVCGLLRVTGCNDLVFCNPDIAVQKQQHCEENRKELYVEAHIVRVVPVMVWVIANVIRVNEARQHEVWRSQLA